MAAENFQSRSSPQRRTAAAAKIFPVERPFVTPARFKVRNDRKKERVGGCRARFFPGYAQLLQLGVLGLRCDEDRNVWVSVLPQSEEILIGGSGLDGFVLYCITVAALKAYLRAQLGIRVHATQVDE